jgi:hypothetical protein
MALVQQYNQPITVPPAALRAQATLRTEVTRRCLRSAPCHGADLKPPAPGEVIGKRPLAMVRMFQTSLLVQLSISGGKAACTQHRPYRRRLIVFVNFNSLSHVVNRWRVGASPSPAGCRSSGRLWLRCRAQNNTACFTGGASACRPTRCVGSSGVIALAVPEQAVVRQAGLNQLT